MCVVWSSVEASSPVVETTVDVVNVLSVVSSTPLLVFQGAVVKRVGAFVKSVVTEGSLIVMMSGDSIAVMASFVVIRISKYRKNK